MSCTSLHCSGDRSVEMAEWWHGGQRSRGQKRTIPWTRPHCHHRHHHHQEHYKCTQDPTKIFKILSTSLQTNQVIVSIRTKTMSRCRIQGTRVMRGLPPTRTVGRKIMRVTKCEIVMTRIVKSVKASSTTDRHHLLYQ